MRVVRAAGSMQPAGRRAVRSVPRVVVVLAGLALVTAACAPDGTEEAVSSTSVAASVTTSSTVGCDGAVIEPGSSTTCSVPGWDDRDFDVYVPDSYDPAVPWPVVIAYHGGGGRRAVAAETTCSGGDVTDSGCLHSVGMIEGFITVYPDGTARGRGGRIRTWNAGGSGDLTCAVGIACERDVDDVAYTADLLDVLAAHYTIESRVIVTGLSNGAAMAHRVGCDLSSRVGVVVAFGGANQQPGCVPEVPVSVLQVHGTEDPCWPYEGGELGKCLGGEALISGAVETVEGWAEAEGCAGPVESVLPDSADDGMTSELTRWEGCAGGAIVALITVIGGGHTWPMGHAVAPRIVGPSTQDFSGSELVWGFAQSVGS